MTTKIVFAVLLVLIGSFSLKAQEKNDIKHENHYRQVSAIETENYKIELSDVHTQQVFCYAKFKVSNKTNDYLVIYPENFLFKFEHATYSPEPKFSVTSFVSGGFVIAPDANRSFVTKITGGQNFHVDNFELEIKDIFLVSRDVEGNNAEKFQLPANKNSFEAGAYKVKLIEASQRTQGTTAKFVCTYTGDKIGIFDPSKLVVSTEKGEFANANRKLKELVLLKGDKKNFEAKFDIEGKILDMQFATMHIDWKDTFKESEKNLLESHQLSFELDASLTKSKNR